MPQSRRPSGRVAQNKATTRSKFASHRSQFTGAEASRRRVRAMEQLEDRRLMAVDLRPITISITDTTSFFIASIEEAGPIAYFAGGTSSHSGLWKTNGTEAGTVLVREFSSSTYSLPYEMTMVNSTLFFTVYGATGTELWKSDGTTAGTVLVRDIQPGKESSYPRDLVNFGGTLYFGAFRTANGSELWKSDGTSAGTVMVRDIVSGTGSSDPRELTVVGNTLYFSAEPATGASYSRAMVRQPQRFLSAISMRVPIRPIRLLTNVNGTLYFAATTASQGTELWKSQGTSATTTLVREIVAGPGGANIEELFALGSTLYFSASASSSGQELWKSDGTSAGTVLVRDISVGLDGSYPKFRFR